MMSLLKYISIKKNLNLEGKFEFVNPVKDNFHVLEVYCDVKTNGRSAGTISRRPDLNVKASVPFYIPFLLQIDKEDVDFDEKYDKAYDVSLDGYIRYEIEGEEETVSFKQDERVSIRSSKKKDENDIGDDAKKDKKKKKKKNNDDEVTV